MKVISKTHVGMVRNNNEDSLLVREPYLFAVADGMGGYSAGEVASRETLKAFEAGTYELRHGKVAAPEEVLLGAFTKANKHTYLMAKKNDAYKGMGTTLTALYLPGDNTAYAAHVGDSRLYLYRNNTLSQITKDHSYVADLLAQGKITSSEAFNHPKKNMLLQALGVEEEIRTDIFHFALEKGDILLLCSDGLSDMLRDLEIANILEASDFENAATALLEQSLDNGGKDNISLIMIAVEEDA
ncbi:MAG: Stp1/IreP family PP2C-type Ser/Thr phosphatase [Phascolarctobacterium sp.]|nr:Stp1/IreP family PP2C-type Ser/Thr phosphatase [Phascolarctobacterium sp.]